MSHIQTGAGQSDDAEHDDAGHGQQDPDDGADLALHRRHSRGRSLRCRGLSGGSAQGRAALLTKSALNCGATTGAKSHEESGPPPDPPLYATRGREATRKPSYRIWSSGISIPGSRSLWIASVSRVAAGLSLIHISEPTRLGMISYAVFCLK